MTGDDDIRALLPDPPPPAPKPREAAIAGALARFDGAPVPAPERPRAAASWWQKLQRPQAGLLTAAALVAVIALPFAWTGSLPVAPAADEQPSPEPTVEAPAAGREVEVASAASPAATRPVAAAASAPVAAPSPRLDEAAPPAKRIEIAQALPPAPPPPPPPAPPPPAAMLAEKAAPIVVTGRARAAAPSQDVPLAVSAVVADDYARGAESEVIVTGARVSKSGPTGRGDWNACTVNDPSRALPRCRKLAGKAPKAVRREADAHLADGLKQAWDGRLDQAIAAFGEAIAVAPELSVAYLNRGLAHDRQGDSEAALADLDRAVQLSPKSARAYYNRSVLLRKYGDPKRAGADEQQAINLDPRYRAVLR